MGTRIILEGFPVFFKPREMDERISVFIQHGHEAGKVHLTSHLEVEEVTGNVDTTLHEVVVEDGSVEIIHDISASTITIDGIVKV